MGRRQGAPKSRQQRHQRRFPFCLVSTQNEDVFVDRERVPDQRKGGEPRDVFQQLAELVGAPDVEMDVLPALGQSTRAELDLVSRECRGIVWRKESQML